MRNMHRLGAIPVIFEVDKTCKIDPDDIEREITKNTKAIISLHMVGFHDSGTAFRPYAGEFSMPIFIGLQFRASEIMGTIMRIQLSRNDIGEDCGVMLPIGFDENFAKKFAFLVDIDQLIQQNMYGLTGDQ
jgi:hypothetical protein